MPAWDDYKAEAKARGSLAHEVYVAVSTPTGGPDAVKAVLAEHLAYIGSLEESGAVMFAGPLSDDGGTQMQGVGMLVLQTATIEEARALVENDPMHVSGARAFTLRKWMINEGSVTMTMKLSSRAVGLG